jgi:phage portal protein BeeE
VTRLIDRMLSRRDGYWEGLASGAAVLTTTYGAPDREAIPPQLAVWAQAAYASNSPVFSAVLVRMSLLSEATFVLQAKDDKHLFGNTSLKILEEPWPDGSSGELLGRMEQDVSLQGNAFVWRDGDRLVRLRPDWTTIVSELVQPAGGGAYRNKIGIWVEPPRSVTDHGKGEFYPIAEVVHWVPIPDPQADFRGMSWMTPAYREIAGDDGLTKYKIRYLENAASPNMLIRYTQKLAPGTVDRLRERMTARYEGAGNAFKTLILDQGADATVIGNSLSQMDFSNVTADGEQRILADSGVPGVLIGLEPLRGAGRGYQESLIKFANLWGRPQWRSVCKALEKFVDDPTVQGGGSRLWFDTGDIAALQDGELQRGQAALVRAQALLTLSQAGYDRDSAVTAVESGDFSLLKVAELPPAPPVQAVQHMLGQQQPGVTAEPLPAGAAPRLPVGPVSSGGGGDKTSPTPRPAAGRRAVTGANGHG